jgi:gamma-D-glutamyl-L-lysine dipeptidyl-peptidase
MSSFAIVITASCAVRKEPSHKSEMISELLLGEGVTIIEGDDDFYKVICAHDSYEGWCAANQLAATHQLHSTTEFVKNGIDVALVNNVPCRIGFATPVYAMLHVNNYTISYNEIDTINNNTNEFTEEVIKNIVLPYLNTPYVWGGRSIFGIDCSGFIQQVFKLLGVSLPRDTYEQAKYGEVVAFLAASKTGDIAFFEDEHNKIVHVGLLLSSQKIIHAHGCVRIDKIDQQGIIHSNTNKRTHQLRVIKRMV